MARQFATGDSVTVAAGGAAGASSNHTVVAVVQLVGTPGSNASLLQGLASSTRVWAIIFDANKPFGLDDFGSGGATLTSNTWYVVAVGKASGSQHYQYHVAPLSTGVWTHTDSGFNVGNGSGGTTSIQFAVANTTGGNVALAAVAEYAGNLSNAAVEALGVTSMDNWLAASPRAAWQFNQAATSDAVTDLTGGGADQTAISGTTVVSDPAGWSYSTGGGGASVAPGGIFVPVSLGPPTTAVQVDASPDGISVPVSLGSPTGSVQVAAAPNGISVPVALGSPTLAWLASIAPDGIAVPVSPGSPTVGTAGLVPDGVAVPVTLGAPTLAWSAVVAPSGIAATVALGSPIVGAAPVAPDGISVPVTLGAPAVAWSATVAPSGIAVPVLLGNPTVSIPGAVIHRPDTGTVTRPNTGVVTRPSMGTVSRP